MILLAACGSSFGTVRFDTPVADFPAAIATAANGDVLVVGTSYADEDIFRVLQLNGDGRLMWQDEYEGAWAAGVVPTASGVSALAVLDDSAMLLLEYDTGGELGSTSIDTSVQGWDLSQADNGGMAVVGQESGRDFVGIWRGQDWAWKDYWDDSPPLRSEVHSDGTVTVSGWDETIAAGVLRRYSPDGEQLWQLTDLCGSEFALTADGGVIVAGAWGNEQSIHICRVQPDGTFGWWQTDSVDWEDWIGVSGVAVNAEGRIVLGGTAYERDVPSVVFTRVYDADANLLWRDRFTGTDEQFAFGGQVAWGLNGTVYSLGAEWSEDYALVVRLLTPEL